MKKPQQQLSAPSSFSFSRAAKRSTTTERTERASTRTAASDWTDVREKHLKAWVVQMARTASLLDRSQTLLRAGQFILTFLTQFCTSYTTIIPVATLGCQWVGGNTCINLQISSIVIAVVGSILALIEGRADLGAMAKEMMLASKQISRLARRIDLQLLRNPATRENVDYFCESAADEYDQIMNAIPALPRFVFRKSDLMNITLLSAYMSSSNQQPPFIPPPAIDEILKQKIEYELQRFNEQQEIHERAT